MKSILVVTSTNKDKAEFQNSLLAKSLDGLEVELKAVLNNTGSIGEAYNQALIEENRDKILVFVHSDVSINDHFLALRVNEAIEQFDVIGVAGSVTYERGETSWAWNKELSGWKDQKFLSGAVRHTDPKFTGLSIYGRTPMPCAVLDGVFLAVNTSKILDAGIKFDPRLRWDFYDLDFSRRCVEAGLLIGTWPIAITHASAGRFGSLDWQVARIRFLKKEEEINKKKELVFTAV